MGTNLNKVTTGTTISASDLRSNDDEVEKYINGGIKAEDLESSQWVRSMHIRPPNFFGAPSPRTELVSSDVHSRQRHSSIEEEFTAWRDITLNTHIPIEGMAMTVHVTPKNPGQRPIAHVYANCYAREISFGNGNDFGRSTNSQKTQPNYNKFNFATFYMFVQSEDEEPYTVPHTGRRLFAGSKDVSRSRPTSPQNLCWQTKVVLQHGINHVYIGVKIQHSNQSDVGYRLLVSNRNFITDVHYI